MMNAGAGLRSIGFLLALGVVVVMGNVPVVTAHDPAPRGVTLDHARVDRLDDGHVVITMEARGDLKGLITLTLEGEGDGSLWKGEWALVVAYIQDLNEDGTIADEPEEHPHSEEPGEHHHGEEGEPHRERVRFVRDGTLSGQVLGASLLFSENGSLTGIEDAQLKVSKGSLKFQGAHGTGQITAAIPEGGTLKGVLSLLF
jgi:hypothetical protein